MPLHIDVDHTNRGYRNGGQFYRRIGTIGHATVFAFGNLREKLCVVYSTVLRSHVDFPIRYADGQVAWEFPERLPRYVVAAVGANWNTLTSACREKEAPHVAV